MHQNNFTSRISSIHLAPNATCSHGLSLFRPALVHESPRPCCASEGASLVRTSVRILPIPVLRAEALFSGPAVCGRTYVISILQPGQQISQDLCYIHVYKHGCQHAKDFEMTLGMTNCTNSGSSVVCTLNLLLIGLGLTNVGVICWLEDGSVKSSSAVLSAVPCVAILSGLVGCVSQFYHGCLPLHIATVLASIVLLLGGFCVITARKDDVVSQIIQSGENYDVASGVVSWSQILFLLMVCNQVAVLLSVCLVGCCDDFSRQKAKARKRDFARHFHRFVGGCPHPSAEGFPGSRASKNGALPASRAPNWRVPRYADNTAVADSCQSNECGEIEDGSPSAAARVPIRPACTVELRSLAQSGTDTHTRVPGVGLSYMPPVPLSMDLIMTTIQHSGNTGLETPGLKTFEEAHVARAYAVVENSTPADSDVENPDSDGAASNFESPCRSISPSLHSAKSELLTDIQEATLNMRNRMPDPDFFAISARTCFCETTENEMSSDEVC